MMNYKHWRVTPENDMVWLYFDRADKAVNTINHEVLDELSAALTKIAANPNIKGLIIASAKSNGFIAGADVEEFSQFTTETQAAELIEKGHAVFHQLEAMPIPTVAMISGFCLGGGLELALACRYRVVEDDGKTKLGLPEVLLGIHPGWGGSIRLLRLIGAPQAMDLILSGRTVIGKVAAHMGFADVAVPRRQLERAALYYLQKQPKPHRPSFLQALSNHSLARPILAVVFRNKVRAKVTPDHYPAPYAVIDNWLHYGVDGKEVFRIEAESVTKLALSETARNLIRLFLLQSKLKALGKSVQFTPQHVHVIGAGTMGGDIAAWCALQGLQVTLQDREPKYIAPAMGRAYALFQKKLKVARLVDAAFDRLTPDPKGLGVAKADVIIEAIFENLAAKRELFKHIENQCKPDAILATNTSGIPLDEINSVLRKPERLVGLHFFNPVAMMQLVEVVQGERSDPQVVEKATAFVHFIDKLPVPVKSAPGFLVNRLLMPYLMEAMILFEEGVPATQIDQAAVEFGMPMGPIKLADTIGLDVCLAVAKEFGESMGGKVPPQLEEMVAKGELGRKTNKGFYVYRNGQVVTANSTEQLQLNPDITDRMILRLLNESVASLREQIVVDVDLLDAGVVFGTGFAPFRGGPMSYAKSRGYDDVRGRLQQFAELYGERFKPDAGWKSLKEH